MSLLGAVNSVNKLNNMKIFRLVDVSFEKVESELVCSQKSGKLDHFSRTIARWLKALR